MLSPPYNDMIDFNFWFHDKNDFIYVNLQCSLYAFKSLTIPKFQRFKKKHCGIARKRIIVFGHLVDCLHSMSLEFIA
jgi:hypothetical protein